MNTKQQQSTSSSSVNRSTFVSTKHTKRFIHQAKNTTRIRYAPWVAVGGLTAVAGGGLSAYKMMTTPVYAEAKPPAKKSDDEIMLRLKKIFDKFASTEIDGERYMTPNDFIQSVVPEPSDTPEGSTPKSQSNRHLELLFQVADSRQTGLISFNEYVLLFKLLSTPQSEFKLAFHMFDINKTGRITKENFKKVMEANKDSLNTDFNYECDLVRRFFGNDGSGTLSYAQFAQFLKELNLEIQKQEFRQYDPEGRGYISPESFSRIITQFSDQTIPQYVKENIEKLATKNAKITYAEYDAFLKIVRNIQTIASALERTDKAISKEEFQRAARMATGVIISPLEVDIIFELFTSGEGSPDELSPTEFNDFLTSIKEAKERRETVYERFIGQDSSSEPEYGILMRSLINLYNFVKRFAIGGIAGAIGATAVYPIDLVKTRMQNQRSGKTKALYSGSFDCAIKTFRSEGFLGLYSGLGPQIVGVAPEKALKLVTNDLLRAFLARDDGSMSIAAEIVAGGGAGASQVVATNPLEIVKIRLQVQGEMVAKGLAEPKSGFQICKDLGLKGMYRGASACFLRDIPFSAIYFPAYAHLKDWLTPEGTQTSVLSLLGAASIAGIFGASITTPADVIKTRLQVDTPKGETPYRGITDCFVRVLKDEGPRALFKGVIPRVVRSSPQFGVTLAAYEVILRLFGMKKGEDKSKGIVDPTEEDLNALRALYQDRLRSFSRVTGI